MNDEINYICTNCNKLLIKKNDFLHCDNCNIKWPIIDDTPQFSENYNYWGEIPQDMMLCINDQIQTNNWQDVLKKHLTSNKQKETYEFITKLNRANWHFFLPLPTDARVLDIGSGLGTISQSLSYYYKKIVSIETVPERLFFSKVRFEQENINNIQLVRANLLELPFPDNYFDLVVMNGVLEWVGLAGNNISPRELQEMALKNIHRVLKKNGYLYIGVENRIGYNYFLGRIDHSYLKYTSLLPRRLANIYSQIKKSEDYRTYTYTCSGYTKLLNQTGFENTQFYCPSPGYNRPNIIFELNKTSINYFIERSTVPKYFKRKIKYFLVKTLLSFNLYKYIVGDYIIFTQKNMSAHENRIINYIKNNRKKLNLDEKQLKDLSLFAYNYASAISFILFSNNRPLFHIKLRRLSESNNTLKQEYDNLLHIKNKIDVSLKRSLTDFLILDQFDEFQILIQNDLPGNRLVEILISSKYQDSNNERKFLFNTLEMVKNFLIKFHKSVQNDDVNFTKEELEQKVTKPFTLFFKKVHKNIEPEKIDQILKQVSNIVIPRIPQHGDFCVSNILIDKNNLYVIDWESYALTYLPLFDIFHILTTSLISFFRTKEINPYNTFKRIYFEQSELTDFIFNYVEDYCHKLNIPTEFIKLCFPLYLVTFYNIFYSNPTREKIIENYSQYIQFYFKHQDKLIF